MPDAVPTDLVEALARQVVGDVSPAELPLFSATAARYRSDPSGTLAPSRGRDDALGFGGEAAVLLITPFALDLAKRVLTRLFEKLGDSAADGVAARVSRWLSKSHDGTAEPVSGSGEALTPEQLRLVADTARAEAAELALPAEQSQRLADAIVATLATRP